MAKKSDKTSNYETFHNWNTTYVHQVIDFVMVNNYKNIIVDSHESIVVEKLWVDGENSFEWMPSDHRPIVVNLKLLGESPP
jgi:hypothetical protein